MRLIVPVLLLFLASALAAEPTSLVKNLSAGKKQHLVTYGTSLTAEGAWVSQIKRELDKQFPGLLTVTNSGENGMWSQWGVENLDARILQKKPDAVTIEFAINDAFLPYRTSVDDARKNLETMIQRIRKQNAATEIILMTMNPPIGVHLERRPEIERYYQMYRDVAAERKLLLVDHYPRWTPQNRPCVDGAKPAIERGGAQA
jgi:acyl-CoA thioesterase-1